MAKEPSRTRTKTGEELARAPAPRRRQPAPQAEAITLDELGRRAEDELRTAQDGEYIRVTLYLHPLVAKQVKLIAVEQNRKANGVYLDALRLYLAKIGAGSFEEIKQRGR